MSDIVFLFKSLIQMIKPPLYDYGRLERFARKQLQKNKNNIAALVFLASLNNDHGKYKKAVDIYQNILDIKPDENVHLEFGVALYHLKDFSAALQQFHLAPAKKRKKAKYARLYGMTLMNNDKFEEALNVLIPLIKKKSKSEDESLFAALGYCYYNLEDYLSSKYYYKRSLSINPSNDDVRRAYDIAKDKIGVPH